ncbi:MAG TPA: DUF1835 domain-containing protein [Steroidobacteraceae bacterium]|jgi:hypothetical protein|nr:DUF1835 domain-containing protein [Steroidobacteraceae bacterium]
MIKLLPPGLHIVLGDSAGGIFTRVFFARDRLLIDQDVLSCGPLAPITDLASWSRRRAEFWSGILPGTGGEHVPSRFNLVANAQRLTDAERIHIWAATGVSEQLFIAFVVQLVKHVGGDAERIALVQFETLGKRRIIGLGELDEAQLREPPEPVPMTVDLAQQYLNAWAALTSPDPTALTSFAREHTEANRWLRLAMQLMTRRFPDRRNGLNYWDHQLLAHVPQRGPAVSLIVGYTMADTFVLGDLVGDLYLFGRLLRLASSPHPLITLSGDQVKMRETEAVLTPFGEQVLKGKASNYPANPIDDWVAGVHLSSEKGTLWFNDGGGLVRA